MKPLESKDQRHLDAVEGWLGLGDRVEARAELEQIRGASRAHPEVLRVHWLVCAAEKNWELAVETAQAISELFPESPFGWVHTAYALHELKRTGEARHILLPVLERFPEDYIMRYNLACYACQLGKLEEAWQWLRKAARLAGKKQVKGMALDDPDLEPLREKIGGF